RSHPSPARPAPLPPARRCQLSCRPPPPASPTPFPYTTLFRSQAGRLPLPLLLPGGGLGGRRRAEDLPSGVQPGEQRHHLLRPGQDRKSTRLNSSHVSISYAVFCLKKKRETSRPHAHPRELRCP